MGRNPIIHQIMTMMMITTMMIMMMIMIIQYDDDGDDDDDDDENENKPNCCRNPIARLLSVYNYLMDGRVKFP